MNVRPFCLFLLGVSAVASAQVPVPRPVRKGSKVTVTIDSSPQQAAIYLDDKIYGIVGYTPFTDKLVKGDYKLIVELPGYKPAQRPIKVDRGSKEFFVPLERQVLPATLDIQANADTNVLGAQVFVDGQREGTAPTQASVPGGRHLVELKKTGFDDYQQWVEIKAGEKTQLAPILKSKVLEGPKGSLLVDADVPDAQVVVDGKLRTDVAPTLVDNLDEGAHVVEVRKPPAAPWKQTVTVKGGQLTKVQAVLAPSLPPQANSGAVRVVSNVEGASVWLDGTEKGVAPIDLADVSLGDHLVEVKAKDYQTRSEKITVLPGTSVILKVDLAASAPAVPLTSRLKIVSPVPEARVFVDGAASGTVPVERDLSPGEHFVTVEQNGYAKYEEKIAIIAGQPMTITAELRAIGGLRFLANSPEAEIVLDGEPIGKTPLVREDISVGEHVITIRKKGFHDFEQTVQVEGGKLGNVNAELKAIHSGPTPEDVKRTRTGLSSYGARTIPVGHFTADGSLGYPYWVEGRATVGVYNDKQYGWDIAVGFRSYLTTWEFFVAPRVRLIQNDPFSLGAFGLIGGGGGFAGRDSFSAQLGGLASINFANIVTVTGRAYLDVWSDRLCGKPRRGKELPESGPDVCTGTATPDDVTRANDLFGSDAANATALGLALQDRDNGVRGYLGLVLEAAVDETFNFFLNFDGAPLQPERAGHTHLFNGTLPLEDDPIYRGRIGVTAKF